MFAALPPSLCYVDKAPPASQPHQPLSPTLSGLAPRSVLPGLCSSVWSLGPEDSMGFLDLWAIYLFSLLAPLLFLLLAIIYYWWCGVGAGFQEVGNRSCPRLTFLGQAPQTTGIWTLVPQWPWPEPLGGWAEQRALWTCPWPAAVLHALASLDMLISAQAPLASILPRSLPRALVHLIRTPGFL